MDPRGAIVLSSIRSATLQLPGTTNFFRWKEGEDRPVIDRSYEGGFAILINGRQLKRRTETVLDEELLEHLRRSELWEPDLPLWERIHQLEALALCAEDEDDETHGE